MTLWQRIRCHILIPRQRGVLIRAGSRDHPPRVRARQLQLVRTLLRSADHDQVVARALHHPQEHHRKTGLRHPAVRDWGENETP